jgi:hypothetical protein
MKMDKTTNLYERCEVVAASLNQKGQNWNAEASAAVCLLTILNEIADSGKSVEELLDDSGLEWRKKVKNLVKPLFTAAKNFQSSHLEPSGLMGKPVGAGEKEEFV